MPWVEEISNPQELRRCIRDLVALSTLPAIWTRYGPREIADSVAAALVSMLEADFIYIAFPLGRDEPMIEVAHVSGARGAAGAAEAIGRAITPEWLRASGRTETMSNPLGDGVARIATAPIGLGSEAILLAGSANPNFPTETQRLLLSIAANDATIALQRWQAEADARRFVSLVERSSDLVAFSDLEGRPLFINTAGLDLVGLSEHDDLSQRNVFDFVDPDDRARARQECWPTVLRHGRWVGELHLRNFTTGEAIPFLIDAFRIDNPRSGRPMNVATVSRDLRAQRQAETELRRLNELLERRVGVRTAELADANEKLVTEMTERGRADARSRELQIALSHAGRLSTAGQMAAALAHELSQPLAAVSNSANAARRLLVQGRHQKIDTVREIMDEIAGQAVRAGQILRRLRDFVTRGESERQVENVQRMIEEASDFTQIGSKLFDVQMRFNFAPDICNVFVNRIQVQQVLVNIMRNALEAMADMQSCELSVSTILLDSGMVEIVVADSGPGLRREIVHRLFEPFVSTKHDGMGLGLTISRSIVEAHGGILQYEPNPEGGTIFRFTLPCATTEEINVQ